GVAVAFVDPRDIDGAAILAGAAIGRGDRQAIMAIEAGHGNVPAAGHIGDLPFLGEGLAAVGGLGEDDAARPGPGDVDFALGTHGGHGAFDGIAAVDGV